MITEFETLKQTSAKSAENKGTHFSTIFCLVLFLFLRQSFTVAIEPVLLLAL